MSGIKRNYTLYTGLAKSTQRQSVSGIYKSFRKLPNFFFLALDL